MHGLDTKFVDVKTDIAVHLREPHPWAINDCSTTCLKFWAHSPNGEVPVGSFGASDADRAPVDERSIKEPHRGGDGDY